MTGKYSVLRIGFCNQTSLRRTEPPRFEVFTDEIPTGHRLFPDISRAVNLKVMRPFDSPLNYSSEDAAPKARV